MNSLVDAVKATGVLGVVGVFVPQDPGAEDKLAKKGEIAFDFGKFWFKGMKMGTGQCNVKAYNRRLMRLIHHGKADPSMIISHALSLEEAPGAYKHFDNREKGWTKVILHPNKMGRLVRCDTRNGRLAMQGGRCRRSIFVSHIRSVRTDRLQIAGPQS